MVQSNPIPSMWETPPSWKIIKAQRFSPRSDSSELHVRLHNLGWGQALGREVPRAFDFDGQWGLSPQEAGEQGLHSWGAHTRLHTHWDPGQSSNSRGVWARLTWRSWGSSGEAAAAHCGDKDAQGILIHELSQKSLFWDWDLAPANSHLQ